MREIGEFLDNAIRKSFIGERLFGLRKSSPRLYAAIRSMYSRTFRVRSEHGLERYQVRALNKFFSFLPQHARDRNILEIGSDLDARTIRELHARGCKAVIGINPEFDETRLLEINRSLPDGVRLQRMDLRNSGLPSESLGATFSVSVFEHLLDFEHCLSEMFRLLTPGGIVYAEYGPIWSSSLGHHVYANVGSEQARHWDPTRNPVPDHGHLLLDRQQMAIALGESISPELRTAIVEWIYDTPYINRLFYEDYMRVIDASPFELVHMDVDKEHIPEETEKKLVEKYPGYKVFNVRNVEIVLKKPAEQASGQPD